MSKFFGILVGGAILLSSGIANAYEGGWYFDNNIGGREILNLGDATDNSYLRLRGTALYCVRRGVSYQQMRNAIASNYPYLVAWWIDESCADNYVRVCVFDNWDNVFCSTYQSYGWYWD